MTRTRQEAMKQAIITMAKALGQLINAYDNYYDRTTSELIRALADWVTEHQTER